MSLSIAGVWEVGVWEGTVWENGVWREGAAAVGVNLITAIDKLISTPEIDIITATTINLGD